MASTYNSASVWDISRERLKTAVASFFGGIQDGYRAYLAAQSRAEEIEDLNAKSDAQLKEMGLRREDISRYVFRDLIDL